ncbi:MAG: hypothetical protein GHCLOJNM_01547 [bacterium]|nr:hypothetical protein [bacterium]
MMDVTTLGSAPANEHPTTTTKGLARYLDMLRARFPWVENATGEMEFGADVSDERDDAEAPQMVAVLRYRLKRETWARYVYENIPLRWDDDSVPPMPWEKKR